ncbi:TEX2-like protein, partial [Mya arenaria]
SGQSGGAGKTLLKYINKIAASKYFQSVSENKYVKKAMTGVSNTPLVLTVEHVLVMPNMDDLVVPILSAGSDMESSVPMHQTESGHEV